jgi:hypothetical protein
MDVDIGRLIIARECAQLFLGRHKAYFSLTEAFRWCVYTKSETLNLS